VLEEYRNKPYPDSLEIGYLGMLFRYWSSFIDVRPADYYEYIDIQVLFVHGKKDYRIPVESSGYVERKLPDKPFEYLYYPKMAHGPSNYQEGVAMREAIAAWIIANDP
jgi:dipeptidyl aminopeptidase/acylaminoacyl peptidase